jgi:hypothetical protein
MKFFSGVLVLAAQLCEALPRHVTPSAFSQQKNENDAPKLDISMSGVQAR